jgi:phosphatidylglycerophosphate synthase
VPLGVAFVPLAGRPSAALAVLALAAVSDMLDGWLARRSPQGKGWGAWLDPLCDKFFIVAVMAGLYLFPHPPLQVLLIILTREAAILLLFVVRQLAPSLRGLRYDYSAHALGKATTVTQFLTAAALLQQYAAGRYLAVLCAALGLLCAGVYAKRGRVLAQSRHAGTGEGG